MAYKIEEKSPYLIARDHYDFFLLNTETGIITDRWGQSIRTNSYLWSLDPRGKEYKEWISFFDFDPFVSADEIARQLYAPWKALAKTGIVLRYSPMGSTLPNKRFDFVRAIMNWRDKERFCINAGKWYIDIYYRMMMEQFLKKYCFDYDPSCWRENYEDKEKLFHHVFIYENLDDASYLYNLILREGTLEFWADTSNTIPLHHYCLEKHRRNEPLTEVRNLWNDYSKTLLDVISNNPIINEVIEEEEK